MMEGGLHKEAKGLTEISFSHALDGSCTFKLVVSNIVEFAKIQHQKVIAPLNLILVSSLSVF